MARWLKYGLIFIVFYGIILLVTSLFLGYFRPIEANTILPLFSIFSKSLLKDLIWLDQTQFLLVLVIIQVCTAFVQGAIIGVIVSLFVRKKTEPIQ